ncbi:MAG: prepilin-type N-terminal cleavage/methylation domain-containing protein [Planctomycetes bacterium]|nr:prepilin-type N-terminal cleavage/methylation domain-containing protein [Planctomycetota bacterium]
MTETRHDSPRRSRLRAFTLIELLVVLFIIALLISVLLPSLAAARGQMRGIVCSSNIQQIMLANRYYAEDHNGVYCPGASNVLSNLHRWHGTRDHASRPFDSARGPLVAYLGDDGRIRACPQFPSGEIALESGGFERGNGGYGYNNAFIGVQVRRLASGNYRITNDRAGVVGSRVARPVETVMFTDSAFAARNLIEYSFAEPRFHPRYPKFRADPSIHFRHRNRVNVGWCDGHVDARTRTYTWSSGLYPTKPERFQIGWFGKRDDNSLFDLE